MLVLCAVRIYTSPLRLIGPDRPRVVVSSLCGASEFVVYVATHADAGRDLLTIPADGGEILRPACDHTLKVLTRSSLAWRALEWLPRSLVCGRMMVYGASLKADAGLAASTIFYLPSGPAPGVAPGRSRDLGIALTKAEYDRLLADFEAGLRWDSE